MGSSAEAPSCTGHSMYSSSFLTTRCYHQQKKHPSTPSDDSAQPLLLSSDSRSNLKRVRFGSVEVIELCMIMGDHPKCRQGPAVCVSADVVNRATFDINEFHRQKPSQEKNRKLRELHLSVGDRRRIIRHHILEDKSWECILMCHDADVPQTFHSISSSNQIKPISKSSKDICTTPSFAFLSIDPVIKFNRGSIGRSDSSSRAETDALRNQTKATLLPSLPHQSVHSLSSLPPVVSTHSSRFRHGLSVTERQALIAEEIDELLVEVQSKHQKIDGLLARISSLDTKAQKSRKLIEETMRSFASSNQQSMGSHAKARSTRY